MNTLTSLSKSNLFFRTKMSILSFYGARYSNWSEQMLVILEYLQLISQGLLIYPNAAIYSSPNNSDFTKAVIYFFKLLNPSCLMPFHEDNSLTYTILLIVICCMLLKYLLAAYVVYIAYRNQQGNRWLLSIWGWIFRRQSRILYFFFTSFWTCLIQNCSTGAFVVQGMDKTAVIAISSILIAIEYAFTVILGRGFSYVLVNKNFLASKSYGPVMITLHQKLVIQIAQLIFQEHLEACIWIIILFNLSFNLIRSYQYYSTFPLYNLRALIFQGGLLNIVTALNIACLFHNTLQEADYQEENVNFIVIVWIIISVLSEKLSRDYIQKETDNLVSHNFKGSIKKLFHKVFALKQVQKRLKLPHKKNDKYDSAYLISATGKINSQNAFILKDLATSDKQNANRMYLQYLEDLSTKFPKESIIQLHIAKLCIKYPELYPKAINIISKLTQERWSECSLPASLLRYEIEKKIRKSINNNENTLDLLTYMKNHLFVDKLIKDILTQIDLKITICNNMVGEKSNIGLIFNNAQLISKYKLQIQKQMDLLPQTVPSSFMEPDLICAGYHLILENSLEAYMKYNELYWQKSCRNEKVFEEVKLNPDNLYQDTNAFLILSGEKSNNGQIVYSSLSIENLLGGRQISYNKAHISTLFPLSFQSYYSEAFRKIFENGEEILLNQGKEVFLQHKDGHIVHAEVYIKIHPYLARGLSLDMMIRPIPSSKEYMIIKEDGTIEGATKGLVNDLRIKNFFKSSSTLPNIQLLSEELWSANQAFNMIAKIQSEEITTAEGNSLKMKSSDILDSSNYYQALNIYKTFSVGKRVEVTSLRNMPLRSFGNEGNNSYLYDCSFSIVSSSFSITKLVKLEKMSQNEANLENDYISADMQRPKKHYMTSRRDIKAHSNEVQENEEDVALSESENIDSPEKVEGESRVFVSKPETNITNNGNLLSPTDRNNTNRPFIFTSSETDPNLEHQIVKPEKRKQIALSNKAEKLPAAIYMSSLSSNRPNSSSQYRTASTTFRTAIAINFRPKSFITICIMFYLVILVTFVSQVILKVVSDDIMTTLAVKKNILTYSQLRTYRIVEIASNARVGLTNLTATSASYALLSKIISLPSVMNTIKAQTDFLQSYNEVMLNYVSLLDEKDQNPLFSKDIEVYDYTLPINNFANARHRYINQFQVIDETIQDVYRLKALSNYSSADAYLLFYSLRYNLVNDFLYKCDQITVYLTQSVENEREYLQLVIKLCLIIVPLLLLGIIQLVSTIIWKQYQIEKKNMLAFIRLKPDAVKEILAKLMIFKRNLQNKEYSEYKKPLEVENKSTVLPHDESQKPNYRRREYVVIYSEMRKRYYGYFIKVSCYVILLIGIMVWNFVSAEDANQDIYRKQNQIQFANGIIEVAGVGWLAMEDAFQSNNSALIIHKNDPILLMVDQLEKLKTIQSQVPEVFLNVDRTYDPQVRGQLFDDNCTQYTFTSDNYGSFCKMIQGVGQRINLVSLMAYYQDVMQVEVQDYYSCNKTTLDSLYICVWKRVLTFMPAFTLLIGEGFSLGNTISLKLEQSIANANHQRNVFLIAFSVSLVIASLLIWYQILRKLKEGYNDFKKVLQLFPPTLILSSFQLKTFLLQHSKQIRTDYKMRQQ